MFNRLVLACAALAMTGCGPLTFAAEVKGTAAIQGSPLGALLDVFPAVGGFANIDFNNQQDFKNNEVTRDRVTSVKLTAVSLRVVSPASQDFSFLDTLTFVARAEGQADAVVAEKTGIASTPGTPPNATLDFTLRDVDLAPYVQSPTMSLVIQGKGRQPSQNVDIEATVKMQVSAKVL